jgi:hypothetical protein
VLQAPCHLQHPHSKSRRDCALPMGAER